MENASKALIMAAEILFGIILLTVLVGAYFAWRNVAEDINDNLESKNLLEFNSKFEIYKDKNLLAHDVVTLVNLVNEYNYPDGYGKDYGNNMNDSEKIEITNYYLQQVTNDKIKFIKNNEEETFHIEVKYKENSTRRIVKEIKIIKGSI